MITCQKCKTRNENTATECNACGHPITASGRSTVLLDDTNIQLEIFNQLKSINQNLSAIEQKPQIKKVNIIDIDMTFGNMVAFMVKWAIAAIPAMLILSMLGMVFTAVLGGLFGRF